MGMVVRSNIMAMNANRSLGMNNSQVTKNLEKLSSGFKINRAGDDASGLAISEKMKAQIKGLETASANSQDGISLVQTAEGALTEVHSMLNRMVELATKSANGTIQDAVDREAIQSEVDALLAEVDRIGDSTNFNGINLLDGSLGGSSDGVKVAINGVDISGMSDKVKSVKMTYVAGSTGDQTFSADLDEDGVLNITWTKNAGTGAAGTLLTAALKSVAGQSNASVSGTWTGATSASINAINTAKVEKTAATIAGTRGEGFKINFQKGKTGLASVQVTTGAAIGTTKTAAGALVMTLDAAKSYTAADINKMLSDAGVKGMKVEFEGSELGSDVVTGLGLGTAQTVTDGVGSMAAGLVLQVGDTGNDFNMVTVGVDDMRANGLGLTGLDVSNADSARASIATIKSAINMVSTNRANLGALQNRLEYTINNLDVSAENMTAANSRIRDTDMAKEMMEYTKTNVLTQAAQAMLAQANQQPQSILQLLQ